jgi:hypothetical protein
MLPLDTRMPHSMRLIMTLLVRNEEDILDWNLRFHFEQGVSFVIATDNKSTDATPDILRSYERQGLLRMIREEADDYSQSVWVTRMARAAAVEHGADWIINSDADEFWLPQAGDLRQTLAAVPAEVGSLSCQRRNFVPVSGHAGSDEPFWTRQVWRQLRATNSLGRDLPDKVCHRAAPWVDVAQGNHSVEGVPGSAIACPGIEILHYPLRSYRQFATKIALGGAAYERNTELPPDMGDAWRQLYRILQQGGLWEWYHSQMLSIDAAAAAVAPSESVGLDARLRDHFLSCHHGHSPSPPARRAA